MSLNLGPTDVVLLVVEILERLGVRYAIGGSFASSLHGVFRASVDADIVADLQLDHVEPFSRALAEAFYRDESSMRRAIELRQSFNAIHLDTMFKIDVFIPKGRPFDEAQLERREAHVIANEPERSAFVASAEDTVLAKLDWYRAGGNLSEQQWRDVLGILEVQSGNLDLDYLRSMAASLQLSELLEQALTEASR
ncbi:MAG TPA: hypothetical protein VLK65_04585 [Vicinamibacteria bacterium]|nr:hypothetical protein [Vicinamibacteria bacterium]